MGAKVFFLFKYQIIKQYFFVTTHSIATILFQSYTIVDLFLVL